MLFIGHYLRVNTQVPYDKVQITILIKISGSDRIPPSVAGLCDVFFGMLLKLSSVVDEYEDRRPFPHQDQVWPFVAV